MITDFSFSLFICDVFLNQYCYILLLYVSSSVIKILSVSFVLKIFNLIFPTYKYIQFQWLIQQKLLRKDNIGTYYEKGKAYTEYNTRIRLRCDIFLGFDLWGSQ